MIRKIVALILRPWLRAKMARCERRAEAAYAAMYDARPPAAKDCYDDARRYFTQAIEFAGRADLADEVTRLTSRRSHIAEVYIRQFRWVGYD